VNKEQFIALGLTGEQAKKAAEASQEELKSYVEKQKFDTVSEENKNLKTTIAENTTELDNLKKSAGNDEALKKQIEDLQADNQKKEEARIELSKEYALKDELGKIGVVDADYLIYQHGGLDKFNFDKENKPIGLEDTIKPYKESKPYIFKQEDTTNTNPAPGFHVGADGKSKTETSKPTNLFEAVASHFQNTANSQK
jgi:hypothetical protein